MTGKKSVDASRNINNCLSCVQPFAEATRGQFVLYAAIGKLLRITSNKIFKSIKILLNPSCESIF
jgi:hypothetical protein